MVNRDDLYFSILNGNLEKAVSVTEMAIKEGISPT